MRTMRRPSVWTSRPQFNAQMMQAVFFQSVDSIACMGTSAARGGSGQEG
jgi:hypothetical protein